MVSILVISERRLLENGAYSDLSVNVVVLMLGLALITRNTVFVFCFLFRFSFQLEFGSLFVISNFKISLLSI